MGGEGQGAKFENKCLTSITQKILDTKKRRRQCDHRGRDWRDVAKAKECGQYQKLEEALMALFLQPREGASLAHTSNCETYS